MSSDPYNAMVREYFADPKHAGDLEGAAIGYFSDQGMHIRLAAKYSRTMALYGSLLTRQAQSAIRFSFGRQTALDDVKFAAQTYRSAVKRLRSIAPERAA